jgi:hypothetical protein
MDDNLTPLAKIISMTQHVIPWDSSIILFYFFYSPASSISIRTRQRTFQRKKNRHRPPTPAYSPWPSAPALLALLVPCLKEFENYEN